MYGYEQYDKQTARFRISYITSQMTYHPEWETPLTDKEASKVKFILNQPFTYLGKGGQMYAFESADGKFVLKFIKFKFLRTKPLNYALSKLPFFEDRHTNEMQRRTKKVHDLYQGYKLAYDLSKENSGLIYLHYNPTFNQFGSVQLVDKLGLKHQVDLDQVVFFIQEKGILFNAYLKDVLGQGDHINAKKAISQIINLYREHYKKGLYDRDYGVIHNTGFVDDKPIHIDMGKFTFDERMKQKSYAEQDLRLVTDKIKEWLKKEFPEHHALLSQAIGSTLP